MLPWLQSNFNFPFSGDVNQKIEPDWFFGAIDSEVGDSEIEKEVFLKVASYGKQIGMLTEVLLSIADNLKISRENIKTLSKLKELQVKVEAIKTSKKERVKENAKIILNKLRDCDSEGFKSLLKEYENER
jgi:hypothetical protein